jgi:hypothetical protein
LVTLELCLFLNTEASAAFGIQYPQYSQYHFSISTAKPTTSICTENIEKDFSIPNTALAVRVAAYVSCTVRRCRSPRTHRRDLYFVRKPSVSNLYLNTQVRGPGRICVFCGCSTCMNVFSCVSSSISRCAASRKCKDPLYLSEPLHYLYIS